jgi:hypothetical protein
VITRFRLVACAALSVVTTVVVAAVPGPTPSSASPVPHVYGGQGVVTFGDATPEGSPTTALDSIVTGMATTPDGKGYWLVAADGGVFAYGDAPFEGSLGATRLTGPIVGMAATPDGLGYWLVALDGGVFAYGDAKFFGSMGGIPLNEPIVAMAATPDGLGYWLVGADGGVFAFGDATFFGSLATTRLAAPISGMAAAPEGQGYWLVGADGGVFAYGDATFLGSTAGQPIPDSVVGIAAAPDGRGYWLAGWNGSVYTFGAGATNYGSTAQRTPLSPVTAITATPDGGGYWLLQPDDWPYSFSSPSPYSLPVSASITSIAASQVEGDPDVGQGAFCNPYGPCEPWCALFATWVWQTAGVAVPTFPFVGSIFDWAAVRGLARAPTALPAPGDAILYGTGPQDVATSVHTGIVAQVWPDGAVVTVEGDAGPAPTGSLAVVLNGPFLPADSQAYNGFPVYAYAQPTP